MRTQARLEALSRGYRRRAGAASLSGAKSSTGQVPVWRGSSKSKRAQPLPW